MFKRLFTRETADSEARKHINLMADALEQQRKELGKALDELEELRSEHRKLRGRFYAARGELEPPKVESKADVLRRIGYIPGKAPPHQGS